MSESDKAQAENKVRLTPRRKQVMDMVAEGLSREDVAVALGLKPMTISIHMSDANRHAGQPLTSREREVRGLLQEGIVSDKMIATALEISEKTANVRVCHVLEKLGLHSRREAAKKLKAVARGQATDSLSMGPV